MSEKTYRLWCLTGLFFVATLGFFCGKLAHSLTRTEPLSDPASTLSRVEVLYLVSQAWGLMGGTLGPIEYPASGGPSDEDLSRAKLLLDKALTLAPNNSETLTNLGVYYAFRGEAQRAMAAFEQASAVGERSSKTYRCLGAVLLQQGKIDAAIDKLRSAIGVDPLDAIAHSNLGVALRRNTPEDAIHHFRLAVELRPSFVTAWEHLGVTLHELGELDEATDAYRRWHKLAPKDGYAAYHLGEALRTRAYLEAGLTHQETCTPQHLQNPALANNELLQEAVEQFRDSAELEPDLARVYGVLALALSDQGENEEAWRLLDENLGDDLDPDTASGLRTSQVVVLIRQGQSAEAAKHLDRLFADYSDDQDVQIVGANCRQALRNTQPTSRKDRVPR